MCRLRIVLMSMIVALAGSGLGPAHAEILKRPAQLLVAPSGGTVTVRWFWSTADNNEVIIRRNGVTVFTEAINNAWGNRGSVGIWSTAVNAGDSVIVTAAVVARTLPPRRAACAIPMGCRSAARQPKACASKTPPIMTTTICGTASTSLPCRTPPRRRRRPT